MKYEIIETTDGKYVGLILNGPFYIGSDLLIQNYIFEVSNQREYGNELILSNSNYVIKLKKI